MFNRFGCMDDQKIREVKKQKYVRIAVRGKKKKTNLCDSLSIISISFFVFQLEKRLGLPNNRSWIEPNLYCEVCS